MSVILAMREVVRRTFSGSQVPVNDWRVSLVEVEQSTGHILQDRALRVSNGRYLCMCSRHIIQVGLQSLHDQQRKLSPWEEAEPKELCDVRVAEAGHQLALVACTSGSP